MYNGDGLRTKKTIVEGTEQYTVEYFYEGNKLIALERTQGTTTDYMFFLYDQSDNIVGFELNGTAYYYSKNLQGDVLSILDSNGDVVVKYTYTAWGELVSVKDNNGNTITDTTSVAYLNPIRYRGYVYDDEIGMYYLQSRYYDPYGTWIRNYSSFKITKKGFDVNLNFAFLSKSFCISFANRFLRLFGTYYRWRGYLYSGMNNIRIAKELYAHAILYCVGIGLITSSKVSSSIRKYFDNLNNKIIGRLADYLKVAFGYYLYDHSKKLMLIVMRIGIGWWFLIIFGILCERSDVTKKSIEFFTI